MTTAARNNPVAYGRFLIFIAGMGGLLYGIDVGIVAAALLYLTKTVNLTVAQEGLIVAAVFGGSTASSLVAGAVGDWLGRKKMMVVSGLLFVLSVGLIVTSQTFVVLFLGRLLQGISGGVIAVVVPLYLAECLGATNRGKGTAVFQFMLTLGIVLASLTGLYYTHHADAMIAAAHGDASLILAAQNHAWRGMFLSVVYPGLVFLIGSFFLSESPRWLFQRGRAEEAMTALRRSSTDAEAEVQIAEMRERKAEDSQKRVGGRGDSLLQRKYVVPFVLACIILGCNQATGINSILSYLVVILRQAGMSAAQATQGDLAVKVLNCVMTVVAIALIDRRGRKFLLTLGTSGIILALLTACALFYGFESRRVEMAEAVQKQVVNGTLALDVRSLRSSGDANAAVLSVLYDFGDGDHLVSKLSDDADPVLKIEPEKPKGSVVTASAPHLVIKQAKYGTVASQKTGWLITACLALFIASFAVGPGVVVWLALSELMPTRIRSTGMGIALLINQFVSTGIAGIFPSVAGKHGYFVMFAFWAGCTVIYFITAAFFLPETKGRTLEEIERLFDRKTAKA